MILAGVLDGIDGRIARLLKAQSRFGAELDSLADSLSFGMAPALILFLWSLQDLPRFGWFAALAFAICCALRLARFNAQIDVDEQPHKSAGFLTGVPAPVGAGLAFLPLYLWLASGERALPRSAAGRRCGSCVIAFLMISNLATLSWTLDPPAPRSCGWRLIALVGLVFAALLTEPWWTLAAICAGLPGADAATASSATPRSSGSASRERSATRRRHVLRRRTWTAQRPACTAPLESLNRTVTLALRSHSRASAGRDRRARMRGASATIAHWRATRRRRTERRASMRASIGSSICVHSRWTACGQTVENANRGRFLYLAIRELMFPICSALSSAISRASAISAAAN